MTLEHGDQVGSLKLKELFDDYPFVDLCNVTRVLQVHNITRPLFPMTWRFLPLMDPTGAHFLSRDSDTLISMREVTVVNQWLRESNATFHLMRDHPGHCSTAILGGIKTDLNYFIFSSKLTLYHRRLGFQGVSEAQANLQGRLPVVL